MASKGVPAVGIALAGVMRYVRFLYPSVPRCTTDQLDLMINDKNRSQKLVLLDVRELPEIEVSRLPDSIPISPSQENMAELLSAINKKVPLEEPKTVVAYCAVEWRASIVAKRLMVELAKPENFEIRNKIDLSILEGSMFKWGNERKYMITGKEETKTDLVHGKKKGWEKLVHADIRTLK